jgi:hypothetical protein
MPRRIRERRPPPHPQGPTPPYDADGEETSRPAGAGQHDQVAPGSPDEEIPRSEAAGGGDQSAPRFHAEERRRPRLITAAATLLGPVVAVVLILIFIYVTLNAPTTVVGQETLGYNPAPPPPKGAEVVYLGIEPIEVDSVSLQTGTFETSFYIWWRWRGSIDPCPTTQVLNSTAALANYVPQWSYTNARGQEEPYPLGDGWKYQSAKISVGVSDPFSINRYPLDDQLLTIRIENSSYDFDQLVYVPDYANLTKHPYFEVAGWNLAGASMSQYLHHYGTNFGVIGPNSAPQTDLYSQVAYQIKIERPVLHFLMKLFLPMFVVLVAALSSLFVKADDFDVRLAMAGTGLLTLIFLQQGYSGDLPSTSPIVLMDEIYALAYVAVGATFLRVVYTTTRVYRSGRSAETFARLDRVIGALMAATFLVGVIILVAA